ncbi:MAG TPA: branched-chain amino acid ABC transporter permease [Acidimicrobiales bacterium]|nr:branched-chain amino acid ABC transporter permease [Acidimicrobiales bacterium]
MQLLASGIGFGIVSGAVLALGAMGFSLQFGMTNVLNLAYGSLMSMGALVALLLNENGVSIWVAALLAAVAVALTSLLIGSTIYRAFARRGARLFTMAILSVAVSLIVDFGMGAITRSNVYQFSFPQGAIHAFLGMTFTTTQLIIVASAAVIVALLEGMLHYTKLGVAIRATAANTALARASGIRTSLVVTVTWLTSGALCGLGGVALALSYLTVSFQTGTTFLPYILAAVIVAGIGAVGYAALSALILALAIQISGAFGAAEYNVVIAVGVLLVMLMVRPQGFFGELWEKVQVTA